MKKKSSPSVSSRVHGLRLAALTALFSLPFSASAALVAHWTFDSNLNSSVGGFTGVAAGNAAVNTTAGQFFIGTGSVAFDGAGDNVQTSYDGILGSNARTVSAWFRVDAASTTTAAGTILSYGDSNAGQAGERWELRLESASGELGKLRLEVNSGGIRSSGSTVYDNVAWHNVVVSYAGAGNLGTHQFFVNGKLVGTVAAAVNTTAINTSTDNNVIFGDGWLTNTTNPTRDFNGRIDDVGFFNNASVASDAAIINGLGRLNGLDLTYLDEAQGLWAGSIGGTASIGGKTWEKVTGLTGSLGDIGGTWAGNNAFIVLDGSGNGIALAIPEPSSAAVLASVVALGFAGLRRRRRTA
jgi:hypothetical protein